MESRDNPCKPRIEEKVYKCPPLVDANIKGNTPKTELKKASCGKGFGLFGKKDEAPGGGGGNGGPPAPPEPEEMSPPPYSDLGKKAKDVFGKGYHFGLIKLDCKTKSNSGVEFSTSGHSNQETGKVFGSLETKYKVKDYGLTFSEKWNTDNTLGTEISVQDELLKGLKLSALMSFAPQTGNKSAQLKSAFVHERVALNADVDVNADAPVVNGSAVVGYQGWLAGYQAAFDVNGKKLTKSNFALGFTSGDFTLHTNVITMPESGGGGEEGNGENEGGGKKKSDEDNKNDNNNSNDGQEFGGSIYQKINPKLETAINLAWSSGSNNTKFGIGCKYDLDQDAAVRVKVDNQSQIGFGYQQKLRDGVTLTLSSLIDGKNFNQGGHKVGLALELEA